MNIFPRPNYGPIWAVLLILLSGLLLKLFGIDLIGMGLTLIFIGLAFLLIADWFIERRMRERQALHDAMQEDVKVVRELRMMTPEQIEAAHESRVIRRHIFNGAGARHEWIFPDGTNRIPETFTTDEVRAVWLVCDEWKFAPLSTWNDGTRNRRCAEAMYYFLLYNGLVDRPNGNMPAVWKRGGYEVAAKELWEG